MAKQKAIKLNLDGTFEEKNYPRDVNQIKVGKDDEVRFSPKKVFKEVGISRFKLWKQPRHLVFFVDGAVEVLGFSNVTKSMQVLWTKKEATEHTKKQVAKARLKFSPITWGKTILILIFLIIVILLQLYSMSRSPF